jgi:predicted metal-dependent peptidase
MRVLQDAIIRLLKERPFYGHFLLGFRRREGGDGPVGVTMANGAPLLTVHAERFAACAPAEQEALLEHVLKHVLHLHMVRRRGRHPHDWDMACDLAINPTIAGLPQPAPLPTHFRLPDGLAAEEYYAELAPLFDTGNQQGRGVGDGGAGGTTDLLAASTPSPAEAGGARTTVDDHQSWAEADSTPAGLVEAVVRGMVRDAVRQSHGEIPGEVRPLVEGWLSPSPIPWRQVLRQFVATAGRVGRRSSWKREHRRFGHATPGLRKERRLHLLIGIDVSDSTDVRPLREAFARELLQVAGGRDCRLTVLYAGSRIQRIDSFASSRTVTAEVYQGGGFTDLRPVFAHARSLSPRPGAVIYLTDGFGEAPPTMEFPTLWVLTRDGQKPAPWGVELRLEV